MDVGSAPQEEEQAIQEEGKPQPSQEPPEDEEETQQQELEKYRRLLCSEFAAVSGTDDAVAQRFLAENCWDVQMALNSYFEPPLNQEHMDVSVIDLTDDSASSSTLTVAKKDEASGLQEDDNSFSLITWNIDGLDANNLQERIRGVCSYLALYSPDVVFLQEVIPPTLSYLQKRAVSYTIIPGNSIDYFTAIMLKKSRVKVLKHEIMPFPTTVMRRNLLTVHATISGVEICFMTSHLESTKNFGEERIKQLKLVLAKMEEVQETMTVIFGGDTNLRHKEVDKLGGLPDKVLDIWEFLGKPKHCHYTWDTSQNTNLNVKYKCKMRFDRLFLRAASPGGQISPQNLELIGLEKLDCGRFPSDHWGLLCNFEISK